MPIATEVSPRGSHSTESSVAATKNLQSQRGSPAPRFEVEKPRGRSLSPVRSRAAAAQGTTSPFTTSPSTTASTSTSTPGSAQQPTAKYIAPPLTWRTAAQDAKAGIYYTKDEFPSSSFLPPPFSREPVQVQAGERVELLEEVDEYAVRVKVLRTGKTGLIPAWNTEGALDRLTRINTAFNEAATCPSEARALRRRFSESSAMHSMSEDASYHSTSIPNPSSSDPELAHSHARCVPFAARVRFGDYYANPSAYDDSSSDSDSDPDSGAGSPSDSERGRTLPGVYEAPARTLEKGGIAHGQGGQRSGSGSGRRKSVVFPEEERPQVVFRYPSEDLVGAFLGEYEEKREGADGEHAGGEGGEDAGRRGGRAAPALAGRHPGGALKQKLKL
ncbi:hypothetical protein OH77DRAFT_779035 [Trametes cingulata]|nr:hypothetical protein OH77DRAFT_779035 [Trametes cingulata]